MHHHKPDPITGDFAEGVRDCSCCESMTTRSERGMSVVDVVRLVETNKAKLAFLLPFLTTVAAVLANWIVSGEWNSTELEAALSGLLLSVVAAFGAWVAKPGPAEVLLPDSVARKDPVL